VTADGQLSLRGRKHRVLGLLFEPFVRPKTLELAAQMLARGGSVVWMATPPELYEEAKGSPRARWQKMFGVRFDRPIRGGERAEGRSVEFAGAMAGCEPMPVASSLLPDWVYPVTPDGAETVARIGRRVVGTVKRYQSGGRAMFLGFRARDDQSASTGRDLHALFDALCAAGAYPGPDNPERLSRTTDILANRFPNGVITVTHHFRDLPEQWPGGFKRNPEKDAALVARLRLRGRRSSASADEVVDLPPNALKFTLRLDGHTVSYQGGEMLTYAVKRGRLAAFCGIGAPGITVDGKRYQLTESPATLAWTPVSPRELGPGVRAAHRLWVSAPAAVRLPVDARQWKAVRAAVAQGTRAAALVKAQAEGDSVVVSVAPGQENRWLYVGDW